jgi:hypothetical protein
LLITADGTVDHAREARRGVWRRAGHRARRVRGPGARGCARRSAEVRPRCVEVRGRCGALVPAEPSDGSAYGVPEQPRPGGRAGCGCRAAARCRHRRRPGAHGCRVRHNMRKQPLGRPQGALGRRYPAPAPKHDARERAVRGWRESDRPRARGRLSRVGARQQRRCHAGRAPATAKRRGPPALFKCTCVCYANASSGASAPSIALARAKDQNVAHAHAARVSQRKKVRAAPSGTELPTK